MRVHVTTPRGQSLTVLMTLAAFLQGPVLSHLAVLNNDCEPVELLRDYLPPDTEALDDEEFADTFGEACLAACTVEPVHGWALLSRWPDTEAVEIEPADVPAARRLLGMLPGTTQHHSPQPAA